MPNFCERSIEAGARAVWEAGMARLIAMVWWGLAEESERVRQAAEEIERELSAAEGNETVRSTAEGNEKV